MSDQDWRQRSACKDENPELFYPTGNSGPAELQIAEAKAVCARCPVASQCLSWAVENGQNFGVWGGMSEDERRSLKRRTQRRAAASTVDPVLVAKAIAGEADPSSLSDRDRVVAAVTMAALGLSVTAIADRLRASGSTVRRMMEESA